MFHLYLLAILVLASFTVAQSHQTNTAQQRPNVGKHSIEGRVASVENGDTIIVQTRGPVPDTYLIKLLAVDAPDIGQPYYDNARNGLSKLILKKDVTVVVHTAYAPGMVIGTVYREGRDVALHLLEKGLAWHFKRFASQQQPAERKGYSEAQEYASTAGLGLWSDERPTPPWVLRGEPDLNPRDTAAAASPGAQPRTGSVRQAAAAPIPVPPQNNSNKRPTSADNERKYILGPRGGCYYISDSGSKVYVKNKSLCGVPPT